MLEEKDLQAIAEIMQGMESRIDQKMGAMESRIDQKMEKQKQEIMHDVKVLLDTEVTTRFNLLAEGQQAILEKLVPMSRIEAVEADVAVLKQAVRAMNQEIAGLKKAQ